MNEELPDLVRVEARTGELSSGAATWVLRALQLCTLQSDRSKLPRTNRLRCRPSNARSEQATAFNLICLSRVDTGRPYEADAEYSAASAIIREQAKVLPILAGSRSLLAQFHLKLDSISELIQSGLSRQSALPGPSDSAQNDNLSLAEAPNRATRWGMCLPPQATARIES
jgi:hypothetical protein